MKKPMIILLFLFVVAGCAAPENNRPENTASSSIAPGTNLSNRKENWYDTLIANYIKNSDNAMIKSAREDTTARIEWLLDRVKNTDTASYLIFHIGHDITDEGHTNLRFATDGWVYIDSLKKTLYEYDLANDRLTGKPYTIR